VSGYARSILRKNADKMLANILTNPDVGSLGFSIPPPERMAGRPPILPPVSPFTRKVRADDNDAQEQAAPAERLGLGPARADGGPVPDVEDYEERLLGALPRYKGLDRMVSRYVDRLAGLPGRALASSEAMRTNREFDPSPFIEASRYGLRGLGR